MCWVRHFIINMIIMRLSNILASDLGDLSSPSSSSSFSGSSASNRSDGSGDAPGSMHVYMHRAL